MIRVHSNGRQTLYDCLHQYRPLTASVKAQANQPLTGKQSHPLSKIKMNPSSSECSSYIFFAFGLLQVVVQTLSRPSRRRPATVCRSPFSVSVTLRPAKLVFQEKPSNWQGNDTMTLAPISWRKMCCHDFFRSTSRMSSAWMILMDLSFFARGGRSLQKLQLTLVNGYLCK